MRRVFIAISIIFILTLSQCHNQRDVSLNRHRTLTLDTTFNGNDTIVRRVYVSDSNRVDKNTIWIVSAVIVVLVTLQILLTKR